MTTIGSAHNVRVLGSGQTTVVLGHGNGTDQSVWRYLVPHLVDNYRVILYDNMGSGATNPDYFDFDRYSTIEGYAYDLLAILEEYNAGKCIFVGHSLAAMVAVYASILRPDLFHKLVMLSSSPRYMNADDYNGGFEQKDLDQLVHAMESNYEALINGRAPLMLAGDLDTREMQEFSRTLFNMHPGVSMSVVRTIYAFDIRPFLGSVTVPCHIIQSAKDWAVPPSVAEYLHRNLGGKSVVETMSVEGHLPHISSPEVTIPVVLRHIQHDIVDI